MIKGDPSKAASIPTQRIVLAIFWLVWDGIFFFAQGRTAIGLALLLLPLTYVVLALRAHAK